MKLKVDIFDQNVFSGQISRNKCVSEHKLKCKNFMVTIGQNGNHISSRKLVHWTNWKFYISLRR